jgi:hypothetical protein
VQDRDVTQLWAEALEQHDLTAPGGHDRDPWQPIYQSFGQRGFVRITRRADSDRFRIQLAIPALSVDATREALHGFLERFDIEGDARQTDDNPSSDTETDDAAYVDAHLPEAPSDAELVERLSEILEQVRAVGEAIANDAFDELPSWLSDPQSTNQSDTTSSGATAPVDPAEASEVFEPIGDGSKTSGQSTDQTDSAGPSDVIDFNIDSYELTELDGRGAMLDISFQYAVPSSALDHFAEGLAHSLRARFDVHATLQTDDLGPGPKQAIRIRVEPTATAPDDLDASEQTASYLDRVIRFQTLGVPAAETLGLSNPETTSATDENTTSRPAKTDTPSEPDERTPASSAQTPGRQRDSQRTSSNTSSDAISNQQTDESDDGGGVTLGGAPSAASSNEPTTETDASETTLEPAEPPTGPLETGHFSDSRLQRDDATTSLVDVILRHPGYRDERMAQVLSILLSLDYPDARQLVAQAPTHLAWGVGRERASRIKRVVRDSGGKVVFVEPDSIPS